MSLDPDLEAQIEQLRSISPEHLRQRYAEVFGRAAPTTNPDHLRRRIAWWLQRLALGGLSERARVRAAEIAGEADLKGQLPLGSEQGRQRRKRIEPRLPAPGPARTRRYR